MIIKCKIHRYATKQPKPACFKPLSPQRLVINYLRQGSKDFKSWKSFRT